MYTQSGLLCKFPGVTNARIPDDVHILYDDFYAQEVGTIFNDVEETSGGFTDIDDERGGWVGIKTAATLNDGHLISSGGKAFKLEDGKPLIFKTKMKLAEANTNEADFAIGLSDNIVAAGAANTALLGDGGGALPADYDGALFHKVTGTMSFNFETSVGTAQTTSASLATFTTDTTYELMFEFDGDETVRAYIDGELVATHTVDTDSTSPVYAVAAVKADSASAETLELDYIYCAQER